MSEVDLDRVSHARKRLSAVESRANRTDPAVRIVELFSPRSSEHPLEIDRAFCVVSGLTEAARHALSATIDGLRTNNPNIGLDGTIESFGRRQPLLKSRTAPAKPGTALVPTSPITNQSTPRTAQAAQLAEVIDTINRAVMLSSAELRGADAAAEDVDRTIEMYTSAAEVSTAVVPVHSDDAAVLAALDSVAPSKEAVDLVARRLEELENDPLRTQRQAACIQAGAAKSQVLPSDSNDVAMLANLAVAEAEGALAEYDMAPHSNAQQLAEALAEIGLETAPFEARDTAVRVIEESIELNEIRARLTQSIDRPVEAPELAAFREQRRQIDRQRLHIQRRLRSQQQALAIAREQWGFVSGSVGLINAPPTTGERPLPVLVEEPLADLPAHLSGAILSVLLHQSETRQVICVSDQLDLRPWCDAVGDRADWVAAAGWFAGRST